jgi:transposase InsO family protein
MLPEPPDGSGTTVSSPDNGSACRPHAHAIACRALKIRHLRTRPYRPRANGRAERYIRTMLAEWVSGVIYAGSLPRTAALSVWLDR